MRGRPKKKIDVGATLYMIELNLSEEIIKEIKETIGKINQNLKKSMKFVDVIKHHKPTRIEDYKYILECIKREYEYQKTMNHWNYMRNLKGSGGESRGFRFRYFIKDYKTQPEDEEQNND